MDDVGALVDTSAWIPFLRPDGDRERRVLRDVGRLIQELAITDDVWQGADDLARGCRAAGVTVTATELPIKARARHHGERRSNTPTATSSQ